MAGELWGLWLWRLVRGADRSVPCDDIGEVVETAAAGGAPGVQLRAGGSGRAIGLEACCRIGGSREYTRGVAERHPSRQVGSAAVGMRERHELSYQKDDRQGSGRGSVARRTIGPPQHGQRWDGSGVSASSAGGDAGAAGGVSSSLRQSASFSTR